MPRMRTDKQVIEELKAKDPSTRFTRHALRNLGIQGVIPCVMIGRKRLYNMDIIERFLSGELPQQPETTQTSGVRRIH